MDKSKQTSSSTKTTKQKQKQKQKQQKLQQHKEHKRNTNNNDCHVSNIKILHQRTKLKFKYTNNTTTTSSNNNSNNNNKWHYEGSTELYTILQNNKKNFCINFRGGNKIKNIKITTIQKHNGDDNTVNILLKTHNDNDNTKDSSIIYQHIDPLETILVRPISSILQHEKNKNKQKDSKKKVIFEGDSQYHRGAIGMMNGLRCASVASSIGEVRCFINQDNNVFIKQCDDENENDIRKNEIRKCWLDDLLDNEQDGDDNNKDNNINPRKKLRMEYICNELSSYPYTACKITITFYLPSSQRSSSTGGLHFHNDDKIVYTSNNGIFGDPYSSPRTWLPCFDTASNNHRCSHDLTISVTANASYGLNIVGCGEEYGISKTTIHNCTTTNNKLLLATNVWKSEMYVPIPARSLGFAIGPFISIYDPEYNSTISSSTTSNNYGIRQVIIAPKHIQKDIHFRQCLPISSHLQRAVTGSTSGIPLRALGIMREVLGLPYFPTKCYTQVFIPNVIDGGISCGTFDSNVYHNSWLGGATIDARLLFPPKYRLPFYNNGGGRVLQFHQAKCAFWGWIIAQLPLGNNNNNTQDNDNDDDVGESYIHTLFLHQITSIYERACGATGEGGSKYSFFYNGNISGAGLNSPVLDLLPVKNVDDDDEIHDTVNASLAGASLYGIGSSVNNTNSALFGSSTPFDEKNNEELWRSSANNGTESRTSSLEEYSIRKTLYTDIIDVIERNTSLPSMGWLGSHLSMTYLSSNSCSSTYVGCGAVDLLHPIGGLFYRTIKSDLFARIVESRSGMANFVRVIRCCFIATIFSDQGKLSCDWGNTDTNIDSNNDNNNTSGKDNDNNNDDSSSSSSSDDDDDDILRRPLFIVCIDEILKLGGITHSLFIRCLRLLSGPTREPYLRGSLVDVSRDMQITTTDTSNGNNNKNTSLPSTRHFTEPEGFPNTFVRGASMLYMRAGVHVEPAGGVENTPSASAASQSTTAVKGIHLHVYVEPVIPDAGCAFGGFSTLRIVENEGQVREFTKSFNADGSRCEWGPIFLHAKPVSTAKQQTAASGTIESTVSASAAAINAAANAVTGAVGPDVNGATYKNSIHDNNTLANRKTKMEAIFSLTPLLQNVGYQALELGRLTNRTPLLWIRIDPQYHYIGKLNIFQPDACLGEQLFHDGDAAAQLDSIRALAERPLRIQGSVRINTVFDINVHEIPARLLADCLRGSPALHCSLPHTPAIRAQAALALAQWQNNKAPNSHNAVGLDSWLGLHILLLYFKERYYNQNDAYFMPAKFTRIVFKKGPEVQTMTSSSQSGSNDQDADSSDEAAVGTTASATAAAGSNSEYLYLDSFIANDRRRLIENAEDVQIEEDEEYRVRSAVVTAIASIRAKDGQTPSLVLRFLEMLLSTGDVGGATSTNVEDESYLLPLSTVTNTNRKRGGTRSNGKGHGVSTKEKQRLLQGNNENSQNATDEEIDYESLFLQLPFISSSLLADALLSLCYVNCRLHVDETDAAATTVSDAYKQPHPILPLMQICHRLLDWELYKEVTRLELQHSNTENDVDCTSTGVGVECYTAVAASAITALCSMAILKQSTTSHDVLNTSINSNTADDKYDEDEYLLEDEYYDDNNDVSVKKRKIHTKSDEAANEAASAQFYANIFDFKPRRADAVRAAAAQAVVMICCAADRLENESRNATNNNEPLGLLYALEFLLTRILEPWASPNLRLTLAALMLDACTGKVCSFQRVIISGRNDMCPSAARFFNGPLGASYGGDNGSATLMSVTESSYPAANSVNNGARRGLRLFKNAGRDESHSEQTILKVAQFATKLWRTINGEDVTTLLLPSNQKLSFSKLGNTSSTPGICSTDGRLRVSLLSLWQWLWPKTCIAVLRVQQWDDLLKQQQQKKNISRSSNSLIDKVNIKDDNIVMTCTDEERKASEIEEATVANDLKKILNTEIDRQKYRGEMASKAYEYWKLCSKKQKDLANSAALSSGLHPLPVVQKDNAWKLGGWAASASQQRRAMSLDGGSKVQKIRLTVKSSMNDD